MRPLFLAGLTAALALSSNALAQDTLGPDALSEDAAIVEQAFRALHPSLTRYRSAAEIDAAFEALSADFSQEQSLGEVYLTLSRFTAAIQDGHTYANFFNQPEDARAALFDGADKLPFAFQLIGRRMIVSDPAAAPALKAGDEITHIDGRPVEAILEALLTYVKGDGARPDARLYDLQVSGEGRYEPFDIYFPLAFPPEDGGYTIRLERDGTAYQDRFAAVSRAERAEGRNQAARAPWTLDIVDNRYAVMRLSSFTVWNFDFDWRPWLSEAFAELNTAEIPALILDVRGNSGGLTEVMETLVIHLASTDLSYTPHDQIVAFDVVPEPLRPYLRTWDTPLWDISDRVEPLETGQFLLQAAPEGGRTVPANPNAYDGRVILLVDRAASSAVFTLAQTLKRARRATLVGEETGGNLRGITGGQVFFLYLPESGLEIDLPLIRYEPLTPQPDAGLAPDFDIPFTVEDVRSGRDPQMAKAVELARAEDSEIDAEPFLAMELDAFDQSEAGWRHIARRGCYEAAAELIEAYRAAHAGHRDDTTLIGHLGQMRAYAGETDKALAAFREERALQTGDGVGARLNQIKVEAYIAFLTGERETLAALRDELNSLPEPDWFKAAREQALVNYPDNPPPEWPLNKAVLDKLIACFAETYAIAYEGACEAYEAD